MRRSTAGGIALELGQQPRLRSFRSPEEVSSSNLSYGLLIVHSDEVLARKVGGKPKGSKIGTFLQVCKYMQEKVKIDHVPDLFAPVEMHEHIYSLSSRLRHQFHSESHRALLNSVLFYSSTAPERWSRLDQSTFQDELRAAIALLTELEPEEFVVTSSVEESEAERGLRLARERRDVFLAKESWLDARKVHVQQGLDPNAKGSNNTASRLRKDVQLLGVWDGREYQHPAFQFDTVTGFLKPDMATVLEILPKDKSGWRQSFWLFQKHRQLDGRRPADVFREDATAVIAAARSDFEKSDAQW